MTKYTGRRSRREWSSGGTRPIRFFSGDIFAEKHRTFEEKSPTLQDPSVEQECSI